MSDDLTPEQQALSDELHALQPAPVVIDGRDRTFPPPVLRFSELKAMGRSPAHFRAAYEHPRGSNPNFLFGNLVHHVILGGQNVATFDGDRRGKKWADFKSKHAGKLLVTQDELERALDIARKVQRHYYAGPLLDGLHEHELRWKFNGRDCGGRLDVLGANFITDVKTTTSSEPGWFKRQALRLAYHAQGAWYREGARYNGKRIDGVNLIAVEVRQPYAITVFQLTEKLLTEGDKLCRIWSDRVIGCEDESHWPEYQEEPHVFDVEDELELTYGDEEAEAA